MNSGMELNGVRVLFFDLGGVLFKIDHSRALKRVAEKSKLNTRELASMLKSDGKIIEYELGWISTKDFFLHLKDLLVFSGAWTELNEIWCDIFEPIQTNLDLVCELSQSFTLCVISNTCESHVQYLESNFNIFSLFHKKIYSFREGYMKPRREIFETALSQANVKASECLFIDDTAAHVEAAKELGFRAINLSPGDSIRNFLMPIQSL